MPLIWPRLLVTYEWVTSPMFCPHQPCSAPADSSPWPPLWNQSSSCLGFLVPLPSLFPSMTVFSKDPAFSWCAWSRTASSVSSFLPPAVFSGLYRISNESIFSLPVFFIVQLSHPDIVSGKTRVWMTLVLVSNDTSLLLVIGPNSSFAALLSLSLLRFLGSVWTDDWTKVSKICNCFNVSLSMLKWWVSSVMMIFHLLVFRCGPALALFSFIFIGVHFKSLLLSASKMVSSAYLKSLIFLLQTLTPPSSESSPGFLFF